MSLVFDYDPSFIRDASFSGFFITEQSYSNLLDIADIYFKIGLEKRLLKLVEKPHMFITNRKERISSGVGKNASLRITHIGYNASMKSLIALVQLKSNFTDSQHPAIYLTGRNLSIDQYKIVELHTPYTVYGKIGIMTAAPDVNSAPLAISDNDGNRITVNPVPVTRPELTITVENSSPPGTLEEQETEETFKGHTVYKGSRGGKYFYMDDGTRRYVTDAAIARANSKSKKKGADKEVVYNLNFLAPLKGRSETDNTVGVSENIPQ
jgi:hypothetical protein